MPRFAANLSLLFTEAPFLERFSLARKAGFSVVEFQFPYAFEAQAIADELKQNDLTLALFNLPAGDWAAGDRGLATDPNRITEFQAGMERALSYAAVLNPPQLNCLLGLRPAGLSDDHIRATVVNNLRHALEKLAPVGIPLLMEPVNTFDVPGFYLNTVEQAADLIAEIKSEHLFIQYDLYHQQRMCGELVNTYVKHKHLIRHIQLADNPGRHEPGTGEVNYPNVLKAIRGAGYQGWIGCEYNPATKTEAGLGWLQTCAEH